MRIVERVGDDDPGDPFRDGILGHRRWRDEVVDRPHVVRVRIGGSVTGDGFVCPGPEVQVLVDTDGPTQLEQGPVVQRDPLELKRQVRELGSAALVGGEFRGERVEPAVAAIDVTDLLAVAVPVPR